MEEELRRKGKDMGRAIKQLWKLSSDELLREQIEAEDKFRQDHEASLLTNYRKGREEGQEEGLEQGRKEGEEKGRKDVALKLLKQGVEPSFICEATGLSEEELDQLKD